MALSWWASVIGLVGVAAILVAYFALQARKMSPSKIPYSLLNLVGAIAILVSVLDDWNLAAFVIEIAWILISCYGLYKAMRRDKDASD